MSAGAAPRRLQGGAWGLLALCLAGCGAVPATPRAPQAEHYEVEHESPFYKQGPAQAFGPDFNLTAGQRVTMLKYEYGFSQVRLNDFITGYVATEDLKPLPPPPAEVKPRLVAREARGGTPRHSNVKPVANDPLFDLSDIPSAPLPKP